MRKKVYQEELEDDLTANDRFKQEMGEKMTALEAENQALKKQVAYFEKLFAESSLHGSDTSK